MFLRRALEDGFRPRLPVNLRGVRTVRDRACEKDESCAEKFFKRQRLILWSKIYSLGA